MKFFFALLATLFLATPAWAVDVQMGANGNLVFEPAEVTISAGESVHFVNNMLSRKCSTLRNAKYGARAISSSTQNL